MLRYASSHRWSRGLSSRPALILPVNLSLDPVSEVVFRDASPSVHSLKNQHIKFIKAPLSEIVQAFRDDHIASLRKRDPLNDLKSQYCAGPIVLLKQAVHQVLFCSTKNLVRPNNALISCRNSVVHPSGSLLPVARDGQRGPCDGSYVGVQLCQSLQQINKRTVGDSDHLSCVHGLPLTRITGRELPEIAFHPCYW